VAGASGLEPALLDELAAEKAALGPQGLEPQPLLRAQDLERAGLPKGPRWGELLEAAETAQLDGRIQSASEALAWLRAALAQDGGKT
jgi:hypothetical protein